MILIQGWLLVTLMSGLRTVSGNIGESFKKYELVPDILSQPPDSLINVEYPSGAVVSEGNVLTIPQVLVAPSVSWGAQNGVDYTILMIDPDIPSRCYPIFRSLIHWMVINARNDDVTTGTAVAKYLVPTPPPGTGLHRYTFLVYQQPSTFEAKNFEIYAVNRTNFQPDNFAAQYNLGNANGGNFYQAEITDVKLL